MTDHTVSTALMDQKIVEVSLDIGKWASRLSKVGLFCFAVGTAYYLGKKKAESMVPKQYEGTHIKDELDGIFSKFRLSDETLHHFMDLLELHMDLGLDPRPKRPSDLKMLPSYVRHLPDRTESGRILALDLGGTNFRVLDVNLREDKTVDCSSKIFLMPERIMIGTGEDLFDYIAECIASYARSQRMPRHKGALPLGFTFSFPCQQLAINSAVLLNWTKGFKSTGCEGKDITRMLDDAFARRADIKVDTVAVLNDTVGTMLSSAYDYDDCRVGVIFGTGTNACYMEKLSKIKTWNGDDNEPKEVIINTEWGAFGDSGCLKFIQTEYDDEMDAASTNRGKQRFEKMISGMYMGELVRTIMMDLVDRDLLFRGLLTKPIEKMPDTKALVSRGSFYTQLVSEMETDQGVSYPATKALLQRHGIPGASFEDCAITRHICECVSGRAAQLAAAAIAVLINRVDRDRVVVAVDGSLYRYHPKFKKTLDATLSRLVNRQVRYRLVLSEDGSGRGAAICAAVQNRVRHSMKVKTSV
ncbi:hypothetical protein ACOME3_008322 [Neoechinorhynchus agilis]